MTSPELFKMAAFPDQTHELVTKVHLFNVKAPCRVRDTFDTNLEVELAEDTYVPSVYITQGCVKLFKTPYKLLYLNLFTILLGSLWS